MRWRYRDTVLALLVVGNFAQLGARLLVSPLVPDVIGAFDVSKGGVGLALSGMWAVYALLQYPGGVLADRYGERRVVLAAMGCAAAASLALAAAPTFPLFAAGVLLLGASAGPFFPVAAAFLTRLYEGTGKTLSVLTASGSVAGLVAPVAAAFVAARSGWRAALVLGAVGTGAALALGLWRIRPTPARAPGTALRDRFDLGEARSVLARSDVQFTTAVAVLCGFSWQSFGSFFPTFLVQYHGLSTPAAGVAFGAVYLLTAVSQPAAGKLSDAVSRDGALATSALLAAGFVVLLVGGGLAAVAGGALLLGLGVSWPGVLQARFMDVLPGESRNAGFGLVRTVYMFVSAAGSAVTGVLADVAGWRTAYGLVVALLCLVVVALAANRGLGTEG